MASSVVSQRDNGTRATPAPPTPASSPPIACNNFPDLRARVYSDILHMGVHGAAFVRAHHIASNENIVGNQYYNATVALSAGIRLLQAEVHVSADNTLVLRDSDSSFMDGGPLENWLAHIKC
ncbi:hypothetical protein N657DRAFT_681449 [Parathielavia appendiculata]|uniref:Uncharacterized protein n=1 Tax=Parathielavia appendiculata TaxID=2587402 RepID=A0AAN6TYX7_9PEZI|nr:hypothetical protein N657DRAFT_681449 [Parathielavia appendiculata]